MPNAHRTPTRTFRLAAPLLVVLAGACGDEPATSASASASEGETDATGTSAGDDTTTAELPTTGDPTGVPVDSEGRYFLRIDDEPVPPVVLEMDKAKVIEVFGDDALRKIKLLDVDSTPLLLNVLGQIQSACGDWWDESKSVPDSNDVDMDGNTSELILKPPPPPNCAMGNSLGASFGDNWKTSPEFALVRLLTMTPATAVVKGTSLESFEDVVFVDMGKNKDFRDVLFESMFDASDMATKNTAFVPIPRLVEVLQTNLLGSHPYVNPKTPEHPEGTNPGGKTLPITLYDAVNDMRPLADELGPQGGHPGVLLPDSDGFVTQSDALTPDFLMRAVADSNLRLVEGIDASNGAGSMFISSAASPLRFDFNDPDKVQMLGIADAPTMDMRLSLRESPAEIPSCTTNEACKGNFPTDFTSSSHPMGGAPVGDTYVWSTEPWLLEHIVARSGLLTYESRKPFKHCYFYIKALCVFEVSIGTGNPLGWSIFTDKIEDVDVPPPQYLWELLLEIAQIAVHDPTGDGIPDIQEGEAEPTYALKGVPIGLTAEEMIAQIRPNLQEQADFIANVILGKFWKHNDHLDFYYRRGEDGGAPMLFFIGPDDPRPSASDAGTLDETYAYASPGFFADEALSDKLSSTDLPGTDDTTHEKLQLATGETVVYMQDDAGQTYRLRFFVPDGADPTEIVVHVRPV